MTIIIANPWPAWLSFILAFIIYISVRILDFNGTHRIRRLEALLWVYSLSPWLILLLGIVLHLFLAVWDAFWLLSMWIGAIDIRKQARDLEEHNDFGEQGKSILQITDSYPEARSNESTAQFWKSFLLILYLACLMIIGIVTLTLPLILLILLFLSPYYALWDLRKFLATEVSLSPLLHL